MVLPPTLLANADVLPVSGKQGLVSPWTRIRFGAFRTTEELARVTESAG
jgi:hypothetical protein